MTKKAAFVFPGQGSQFVGMGEGLEDFSPGVRDMFSRANETLGWNITDIMYEGPEEELRQTVNTQPALFLHSTAMLLLLQERGIQPAVVAGHSLGEYSALYAAGTLDFGHALWLVKRRGELMQEAGEAAPGAMAAVIGLEEHQMREICAASDAIVPANFNAPGQIVISGRADLMDGILEKCTAAGAKRAVRLPVSGAFHSPLMQPAADELSILIDKTHFNDAKVPVVTNVDGLAHTSAEVLRLNLRSQMTSCVQWTKTVATLVEMGVEDIVEVGPGKVLAGLIRRIAPDVKTHHAGTVIDLDKATAALAG